MDILEVRYIIAHIDLGTFVVWRNPDNVDAEVLDIVKLGDNTGNIANAITIGVFERMQAQLAAEEERGTTFLKSVKQHRAAVAWSVLLSTAIIIEGYDMELIGSLNAQPAFMKRYGNQLPSIRLSNGASVGSRIGLYLNGHVSERLGFKKAMLLSISLFTAAVFITFFAPSVEVLLVGQICQGIPWGVFQTLTTAYAAEVCPVHLRGYLTVYVNLCWVIGQFLSAGVLRAMADRTDEWAYRIPFAIQWIWLVPLIIAISFVPESPWWCVRKGCIVDAEGNLGRLVDSRTTSAKSLDNMVKQMEVTHYLDCFRAVNRRRTIIAYLWVSWLMLPYLGQRTMYVWGLAGLEISLLVMGGLGTRPKTSVMGWTIGSMLILYAFVYNVTVGPICYALMSEVPASKLRSKTVILVGMTYNILNIIGNVAKTDFFFAGTCILSFFFTVCCIPETKDYTYAGLNILFQRSLGKIAATERASGSEGVEGKERVEDYRSKYLDK
ncbi:putative general alpha-glucoside permease [Fusarium oxysporum]|nr:putative general alpha-glucoside permease [Fusarium oxysporum]